MSEDLAASSSRNECSKKSLDEKTKLWTWRDGKSFTERRKNGTLLVVEVDDLSTVKEKNPILQGMEEISDIHPYMSLGTASLFVPYRKCRN